MNDVVTVQPAGSDLRAVTLALDDLVHHHPDCHDRPPYDAAKQQAEEGVSSEDGIPRASTTPTLSQGLAAAASTQVPQATSAAMQRDGAAGGAIDDDVQLAIDTTAGQRRRPKT